MQPAGPRGVPFLGMLPALRRDPIGVLSRMREQYGDVVPFKLAGRQAFLVSHSETAPRHANDHRASVVRRASGRMVQPEELR
jgi:hypothetical protein